MNTFVKDAVNRNMKDKRFKCNKCGSAFTEQRSLKRHTQTSCKESKNITSNTDIDLLNSLKEQNKLLMDLIKSTNNGNITVNNTDNSVTNTNNSVTNTDNSIKTINNITIAVTEELDILSHLGELLGNDKAAEYLKNKLYEGMKGELDCFTKIYLNGDIKNPPVKCTDMKKLTFEIKNKDGTIAIDEGGKETHRVFMNNLWTAYVRLVNKVMSSAIPLRDGDKEAKLDELDRQKALDRCLKMKKEPPDAFMRGLAKYLADTC